MTQLTKSAKMPKRDEQKAREVKQQELPRCVGTPQQMCNVIANPAIKGYDDQYRCYHCNDIHSELVFQESGDTAPGATAPRFISVKEDPTFRARIDAIVKRTEAALESGEPLSMGGNHLNDAAAWRDANRAAREAVEEARRRQTQGQIVVPDPSTIPQQRPNNEALKAVLRKHGVIKS